MIDDFHLESLTSEELSSLRQALDLEEKTRAQQSKLDHIDVEIARLRAELPSASLACTSQIPRPMIFSRI